MVSFESLNPIHLFGVAEKAIFGAADPLTSAVDSVASNVGKMVSGAASSLAAVIPSSPLRDLVMKAGAIGGTLVNAAPDLALIGAAIETGNPAAIFAAVSQSNIAKHAKDLLGQLDPSRSKSILASGPATSTEAKVVTVHDHTRITPEEVSAATSATSHFSENEVSALSNHLAAQNASALAIHYDAGDAAMNSFGNQVAPAGLKFGQAAMAGSMSLQSGPSGILGSSSQETYLVTTAGSNSEPIIAPGYITPVNPGVGELTYALTNPASVGDMTLVAWQGSDASKMAAVMTVGHAAHGRLRMSVATRNATMAGTYPAGPSWTDRATDITVVFFTRTANSDGTFDETALADGFGREVAIPVPRGEISVSTTLDFEIKEGASAFYFGAKIYDGLGNSAPIGTTSLSYGDVELTYTGIEVGSTPRAVFSHDGLVVQEGSSCSYIPSLLGRVPPACTGISGGPCKRWREYVAQHRETFDAAKAQAQFYNRTIWTTAFKAEIAALYPLTGKTFDAYAVIAHPDEWLSDQGPLAGVSDPEGTFYTLTKLVAHLAQAAVRSRRGMKSITRR